MGGWGCVMVGEVRWLNKWDGCGSGKVGGEEWFGLEMVAVGKCGLLRKVSSSGEDAGGRGSETTDRARAVFGRGDQWWGLHTSHT